MNAAATNSPAPEAVAEWQVQLPCHARTVSRVRHRFRREAAAWGLPEETAEVAELLLSEVLTNAVRHAHAPGRDVLTRCVLLPTLLRVEVSDAGDGLPVPREAAPDAESGRGLTLLTALATTWSTTPRPYAIGKTVTFTLTLPPPR